MYNRYAESGRIGWAQKLAMLDPANKKAWRELFAPTSAGLILRAITTEFKFVSTEPAEQLGRALLMWATTAYEMAGQHISLS